MTNFQNGIESQDTIFECKRCGQCCRIFGKQIRYILDPEDTNWSKLPKVYKNIIKKFNSNNKSELFPLLLHRKKKFLKMHKKAFFIPTKIEYLAYLLKKSHLEYPKEERLVQDMFESLVRFSDLPEATECIFLTQRDGKSTCTINQVHPNMCDSYPKNKGYVCINQKKRYFTKTYLDFKKKSLKYELHILNEMIPYFKEHNLEYSFDIIAFLMDFGFFKYDHIENFFITKLNWSKMDFKYALKDLMRYGLIFSSIRQNSQHLECISSELLKKKLQNHFPS